MSARLTLFASTALVSVAIAGVAIAQSGPFDAPPPSGTAPAARPYTSAPAPAAYPAPAPSYSAPTSYAPPAQTYPAPTAAQNQPAANPTYNRPSGGAYYPPQTTGNGSIAYGGASAPTSARHAGPRVYTDPNYNPGSYTDHPSGATGQAGHMAGGQANPRYFENQYTRTQTPGGAARPAYNTSQQTEGPYSGGPYSGGPMAGGPYGGPQNRPQARPQTQPEKRSFWDRIGLGKLRLKTDGYLRAGNGYVLAEKADGSDNDRNELVVDGMARAEVSALTQGGLEYGVSLKLRGQRDRLREGFGGLAGDCPPGFADCAVALVGGTPRALKGHTGQLHNFGRNETDEQKFALEGAHIFLRSAYGDVTLGRDDGSAALFSTSAPSTLPLARASNARTDYTGLDMTKTRNDASGFAEKITYTSPRLLGDQIGFGVQFGASYAPKTEICGVDYCVNGNNFADPLSPLSPELEDAVELGLAIDRTFRSGVSVEGTLNYATASEASGIAAFDDLQSFGTGLNIGFGDFEFGTNFLSSNNGIADDGDYSAFDAGLTWKPAAWGVTLGYGQSKDDLSKTEGRSVVLGGSYDFNEAFTLGAGVQYSERDVPVVNGALVGERTDDALAIFVEGGFTF